MLKALLPGIELADDFAQAFDVVGAVGNHQGVGGGRRCQVGIGGHQRAQRHGHFVGSGMVQFDHLGDDFFTAGAAAGTGLGLGFGHRQDQYPVALVHGGEALAA